MLQVYDDIVPTGLQDYIEELLTDSYFPWFINRRTVKQDDSNKSYADNFQFVHTMFDEKQVKSQAYNEMLNLFHAITSAAGIKFKEIYRIKANLQTVCDIGDAVCNPPHVDQDRPHVVIIYYVNDSDGNLNVFDKIEDGYTIREIVEPKKGRVVVLDGDTYHAGRPPIQSDMRIVINFNFI